jgi:hypothetical protein
MFRFYRVGLDDGVGGLGYRLCWSGCWFRHVNLNSCRCRGTRRGFRCIDLDCRRRDGTRWHGISLNGDASRWASHRDANVAVAGRTPCAFLSVSPNLYPSLNSFLKRTSPDNFQYGIRWRILGETNEPFDGCGVRYG